MNDEPIRICKYCGGIPLYVPLPIHLKPRSVGAATMAATEMTRFLDVYFCDTCQAEYALLIDSLYIKVHDRVYRWTIYKAIDGAGLYIVNEPGVPGLTPNKGVELVLEFNKDIPDITPQNIKEKVALMLTFM